MGFSGGIQGLHFVNSMSNAGLRTGATQAKGIVGGLGKSISSMAVFAPLAIGGAIFAKLSADAYSFSNDFSMAMREVQTISTAVQENFKGIGDEIIDLAANGPDGAIELAKAYYQIVSAGHDGAAGLNLLDVSSKAATAGITDTKTAADGLTTVINAWGLEATEANRVADVMFKTVEKGKTTFPELASNIALVAPMASAMKISYEEIFAATASLTKQGNSTSMAMTQIRSAMIAMNDVLGDGWNKTMTFQEGLKAIRDMAGGSDSKLKEMMGRIEGMNGVLALTGTKALAAAEDLDAMTTATGAMQKAYSLMMEEADNKWSMVHNKWQRELKELGGLMKGGSIGFADFLNNLLTDVDADIINPAAKNIVDAVIGDISKIEDKEKKLEAIVNKINELKKQRIDNYGPEINRLEGQQPGLLQRNAEAFNAGIGLGDWSRPGQNLQAELQSFESFVKINQQAEKSLLELFNKTRKKTSEDGGDPVEKAKTVADALKKISELKDKLGTGTIEEEVQIYLKIANEQEFIDATAKQVREKFKEALGDDIKISPVKSKGTKGIIDIKEIKGQLQPMKLLTAEEEKRLKAQSKQLDNLHMQQEKYEDISDGLSDASKILGALSFAAGELDSDLGESLGKMADLAGNAATMFASLGTDPVSAISSGISIIGNIFSLFKNDESDNANEALDRINKSISRTNKLLDYQLNTMSDLEGASWFTAATQHVSTLNSKLNTTIRDLNEIDVHVKGRVRLGAVNTSGWTPEEWLKAVESGRYSFDGMDESVSSLLDNWISIAEQIDTIESERQYRLLGFTGDDIASNISSGILDGLKLSENGLGDYANGFRDMMNKAIMESLMGGNTDQQVQAFMEKFKEYSALEADGSMFSAAERQELESDYRAMIDAKNRQAEELGFMNDESQAGEEAIKGVFSGASEESVSLLNGQFMAIRMNIVEIKNNAMSYNEIALDSLGVLDDIRDNTAHNVHLVKMQQDMAAMNTKIQSSL